MLKKIMPLSWEVWFNGQQLFSNQEEIYTQVAI
jgi:hypothetical protein